MQVPVPAGTVSPGLDLFAIKMAAPGADRMFALGSLLACQRLIDGVEDLPDGTLVVLQTRSNGWTRVDVREAEQTFDTEAFPYYFLQAFGSKERTLKRLRFGTSIKSDVDGILQTGSIYIKVCAEGEATKTLAALKASSATARAKAKFVLATDAQAPSWHLRRCKGRRMVGNIPLQTPDGRAIHGMSVQSARTSPPPGVVSF
jgi:hypothetical protein